MDDCHSAPGVHLISWKLCLGWAEMKKLDCMGMKYTHPIGWLLALVATLAMGSPVPAQAAAYVTTPPSFNNSESSADDPQAGAMLTIHKRVDEVNVLFIATDKHGKFVRDLNQNDFEILDDHKPPQSIINFRRETDLPLHLGLLIDVSGSVHSRFDFEQNAAINFLQHTLRARFDKAFVVGFNKQSQMAQDFTDNVQLLSNGIHRMQDGGGTALYDAISTDDSGLILRGDKVLEQLAAATGGRAFFPFKMKDMTRSFAAIEDELRSQYVVSYRPPGFYADGGG